MDRSGEKRRRFKFGSTRPERCGEAFQPVGHPSVQVPGGDVTGTTVNASSQIPGIPLQLIKDAVPSLSRRAEATGRWMRPSPTWRARAEALPASASSAFLAHRSCRIAELALTGQLPTVKNFRVMVAYALDASHFFGCSAAKVDKILQGARVADVPAEIRRNSSSPTT